MIDPEASSPACWNTIGVWSDSAPSCPELEKVVHCRNCDVFAGRGRELFDRVPPEDYLAEWGQRIAEADGPARVPRIAVIVFRVADEVFALGLDPVFEVTTSTTIRRIPHRTSPMLLGIAAIKGELVACVSLAAVLGLPSSPGNARLFIVLGDEGPKWAVPVDEVLTVDYIDAAAREAPPSTVARGSEPIAAGVLDIAGQRATLLDTERFVAMLRRRIA